jgi:hypothetical protein
MTKNVIVKIRVAAARSALGSFALGAFTYGTITSTTLDNREFQFVVKYFFLKTVLAARFELWAACNAGNPQFVNEVADGQDNGNNFEYPDPCPSKGTILIPRGSLERPQSPPVWRPQMLRWALVSGER